MGEITRNRFAAPCHWCKAEVPANEGILRKVRGRWEVWHEQACAAPGASRSAFAITDNTYPGLDARESLNEWIGDHYQDESHYVGFEVGDQ